MQPKKTKSEISFINDEVLYSVGGQGSLNQPVESVHFLPWNVKNSESKWKQNRLKDLNQARLIPTVVSKDGQSKLMMTSKACCP